MQYVISTHFSKTASSPCETLTLENPEAVARNGVHLSVLQHSALLRLLQHFRQPTV